MALLPARRTALSSGTAQRKRNSLAAQKHFMENLMLLSPQPEKALVLMAQQPTVSSLHVGGAAICSRQLALLKSCMKKYTMDS